MVIVAVERLIVLGLDHIEFIGRCVKEKVRTIFLTHLATINAREAPRWSISNFFNVRLLVLFSVFVFNLR